MTLLLLGLQLPIHCWLWVATMGQGKQMAKEGDDKMRGRKG